MAIFALRLQMADKKINFILSVVSLYFLNFVLYNQIQFNR